LSRPSPYHGHAPQDPHRHPSLAELRAAIELNPVDRREGTWTKLELIEMDERFTAALLRVHPELAQPRELGSSERRRPRPPLEGAAKPLGRALGRFEHVRA
jgi:hypothetical protein